MILFLCVFQIRWYRLLVVKRCLVFVVCLFYLFSCLFVIVFLCFGFWMYVMSVYFSFLFFTGLHSFIVSQKFYLDIVFLIHFEFSMSFDIVFKLMFWLYFIVMYILVTNCLQFLCFRIGEMIEFFFKSDWFRNKYFTYLDIVVSNVLYLLIVFCVAGNGLLLP